MPPVLRPTISRAPWAPADPASAYSAARPHQIKSQGSSSRIFIEHFRQASSFRPEQTNNSRRSFRLRRELLPRLDLFPDFPIDRLPLLLLSWLMAAPVGPVLVTIGPALLHRPPRIGVPRPGGGGVCSGSLLLRHGLRRGRSGLRCLSGRRWRCCGIGRLRRFRSGIVSMRLRRNRLGGRAGWRWLRRSQILHRFRWRVHRGNRGRRRAPLHPGQFGARLVGGFWTNHVRNQKTAADAAGDRGDDGSGSCKIGH
jgi:hypothetical protein